MGSCASRARESEIVIIVDKDLDDRGILNTSLPKRSAIALEEMKQKRTKEIADPITADGQKDFDQPVNTEVDIRDEYVNVNVDINKKPLNTEVSIKHCVCTQTDEKFIFKASQKLYPNSVLIRIPVPIGRRKGR